MGSHGRIWKTEAVRLRISDDKKIIDTNRREQERVLTKE